jgi:hypothetical protein
MSPTLHRGFRADRGWNRFEGSSRKLRVIPVQVEALPAETGANLVCYQREP